MSKTRNNHYVPQWYQEGFFELGQNTLAYLDLAPAQKVLDDGRIITQKAIFDAPTSRAFRQTDLYSTFFGTSVNDEIERRLFGDIDTRGSKAVKAFAGIDQVEWHQNFRALFEYIDIQKIRTPKGLDWLRAQYPALTQNELMFEMQGIRTMHCTIWTEGVREIISAEDAEVKFIISDHPVTIYNHASSPQTRICDYPNDPPIALKGSQTIFPLARDFCLILTNLEYAKDPSTNPLDKRTFARNYRNSMVRTDKFIRTRKLSGHDVARVNCILKARARRYIAAGHKTWLYPEKVVSDSWAELGKVLLPPEDQLWHFGGEMFARFSDGRVYYQDQFGRTERQRDFLKKEVSPNPQPKDFCGCGSGHLFKECCERRSAARRPTWSERSIRERNLMLYNGISNVLDLQPEKDWVSVRRELTDEKIADIYSLYATLWPLETDLLQLLPKPDGDSRAVYTGSIHPANIVEHALGASLYFGELIIEHPFLHPGTVKKEFSPVENPQIYRQEFLKAVFFLLTVIPLVRCGLVNLVPDACNFDDHLREQMWHMAKDRTAEMEMDLRRDARFEELFLDDYRRGLMSLPPDMLQSQLLKVSPGLGEAGLRDALQEIDRLKESDPLAVLHQKMSPGEKGGQINLMKLAPNFEMAMYLAQATGSCIVTDNSFRWKEVRRAIYRGARLRNSGLSRLARNIEEVTFAFPQDSSDIMMLARKRSFGGYSSLMRDTFKYLSRFGDRGGKPNVEQRLAGAFARMHKPAQALIKKEGISIREARISCAFPLGGIQDNTVNRLLLMSSSEFHLPNVPMAFFIDGIVSRKND